jgi:hypothetical protein
MAFCEQACPDCPIGRIEDVTRRERAREQLNRTFEYMKPSELRPLSDQWVLRLVIANNKQGPEYERPLEDLETLAVVSAAKRIAHGECETRRAWEMAAISG